MGTNQTKSFCQSESNAMQTCYASLSRFRKPFGLHTDAGYLQLGATLVQDGKPIGFYTRKLSSAQLNYTVGEKEL